MPTETLAHSGFADAIAALSPDGPPRVWSLIVTVFGDTGGEVEIGAGTLSRILGMVGVGGSAMRVALHRLKSDGWITARRVGRSSAYRLHPDRLTETRAASARIYATAAPEARDWHVTLLDPEAATREPARGAAIQIAPRMYLRPGSPTDMPGALVLCPGGAAPDWVRRKVGSAEHRQAYDALLRGLQTANELTRKAQLPPVEAFALRVMVVHAWRRVILRHPDLPEALFPEDWPGRACRALVQDLLARLPRPDAGMLAGF